ncbi:hypothetical protein Bhyg_12282 [Pseudolycoriella hygida]|uniref:Uncharacterized protein n=1 Tax=Pseudolycoriella hygida TaxID=35572 RepID=A0A9Q0MWX2_9DIPT|nr:hypothetical protein Bhyg_12282 [Pseudolycoriella hygida]
MVVAMFTMLKIRLRSNQSDSDVLYLGIQTAILNIRCIAGLSMWNKDNKLNKRELIPCRRVNPKFSNDASCKKTCPYCEGYYSKSSLRFHVRYKCPRRPIAKNEKTKGQRFITALATKDEARYHESASKGLQKVYKRFRDDPLVRSLKFDWLITVYGNKLSAKHTKLKSPDMIRGRLRLIARFLHEMKSIEPIVTDLATMYHPKYFDRIVEAIQAVARFDEEENQYGAPCTATSCVTAIKQIGVMLVSEYIKRDDQENQRLTENFLRVMETDIHSMINKTANENQSALRRRVITLPTINDLQLLNNYIQSESNECYNQLSKSFDYGKWLYLLKLTMISILVFNRKRVGDTEDILLEDFTCREKLNENTNQELFASLSSEAKQIARCYSRMKVRGKKNRTVPVLLNQRMEEMLNLLISHREDAGIHQKNKYLFAIHPSPIEEIVVVNAGAALKKFAKCCGAENPANINGTNLRKQLATICVSLKLDDTEVADVADFMGHAELVHRDIYRQNTIDRQVVKMSQWLETALGNVAIDPTERNLSDHNQQKAKELLERLQNAIGEENCSDEIPSEATPKPKNSADVKKKSAHAHLQRSKA